MLCIYTYIDKKHKGREEIDQYWNVYVFYWNSVSVNPLYIVVSWNGQSNCWSNHEENNPVK